MKEWLKKLFSSSEDVSAKRITGIVGALNLYIHSWIKPITGEDLKTHCLMILGLLGAGAIVDLVKKKNEEK